MPPALIGLHQVTSEDVPVESDAFDLVGILSSVDATAYVWDAVRDQFTWESNALKVLNIRASGEIATAVAFNEHIALEHVKRRVEAIKGLGEDQRPVPGGHTFRLQYRFTPGDRRSGGTLWLEDSGRVWYGADGDVVRARGVIRVIDEQHSHEHIILRRNDLDELTGQLNRTRLTEALDAVIAKSQSSTQSTAFLMVAINNLAMINQTFGFDIGDQVIAAAAKTLKGRLRGGDIIGRYSANKFGIIVNDCGPGAMRISADRFLKSIRDAVIATSACQISATLSIGGVLIPDQAASAQTALSHALQALDLAKQKRFDCFMAYEPNQGHETARQKNISIADDVSAALEEQRMVLMLQPIVDAKTLEVKHYECLLRMEKPDGSLVSAGEFIEIAEQLGMSRLIDMRTLELAVDLLKKHPAISLALNVSGLTPSNHDWLVRLHRLTGGRRALTERLVIEITETAAISDIDHTIAFVDALKELGCKTAIDDFGAGYTSFKNLKLLNVDMVKIDGAFVKNLATDAHDLVFIRALRDLAQSFEIETVAEWVQDQATVDILRDVGIDLLQGYFCGEPKPAADFRNPPAKS
ncbi:MAG: EAL domain-containing protein [Hyphomicrobiaceae bacterium]|nr:EAL domain-containing protein [Hyphomicrobiaceae bacterium]